MFIKDFQCCTYSSSLPFHVAVGNSPKQVYTRLGGYRFVKLASVILVYSYSS